MIFILKLRRATDSVALLAVNHCCLLGNEVLSININNSMLFYRWR